VGGPQFEFYDGSCRGLFPIGDSDGPITYTEESYNAGISVSSAGMPAG
jgi:hypothetical protein